MDWQRLILVKQTREHRLQRELREARAELVQNEEALQRLVQTQVENLEAWKTCSAQSMFAKDEKIKAWQAILHQHRLRHLSLGQQHSEQQKAIVVAQGKIYALEQELKQCIRKIEKLRYLTHEYR